LAPGEKLSFNKTVGRRTIENGFKLAGVYKAGKHDLGIGGGICQVSSTLYNAVLLSDLKVLRRQNHSMPVAYLPVGRDATVDYGSIDLVFENTMSTPVAISSSYTPGRLTFRVLGKKDPSISVKILSIGHRSWDTGVKTVMDPTLPAGKRLIVEKGSRGHSVSTYRLVSRTVCRSPESRWVIASTRAGCESWRSARRRRRPRRRWFPLLRSPVENRGPTRR